MMAGAGGAMRATGWRATAIRFQQFGEGVAHELEKRLEQGRLEIAIYWAQRRSDPKPEVRCRGCAHYWPLDRTNRSSENAKQKRDRQT